MRPSSWSALATLCLLAATGGGQARAQAPARLGQLTPSTQPAYSPYLNLLRPGTPFFQNYYGLVRPEVEFRGGIRSLQQQAAVEQEAVSGLTGAATLPPTGHRTAFMNTGGYFLAPKQTTPPPPTTPKPATPRR